jgi:hypothetical protein
MLQATSESWRAVIEGPASVGLIGFDTDVIDLFVDVGLLVDVDIAQDKSGSHGNDGEMRVAGKGRGRHRNVKGWVGSEPSCLTRWVGVVVKRGSAFGVSMDVEIKMGRGK